MSREQLLKSSCQHIKGVAQGLSFFAGMLNEAALFHDHDKISDIDGFYRDFSSGFQAETPWWDNHRKVNRHHIDKEDGMSDNIDLVDVIEHVVDCVMAGMARSGSVYDLELPTEVLQKAFQNTVDLLVENVHVKSEDVN